MSKHLERDLEGLERQILAQSAIVEEMIGKACRALRDRRGDVAGALFEKEEHINEQEVRIEEECLKILALHQPVAIDLRRTATILKINGDLERIADLAMNVAQRAEALSPYHEFEIPESLERMAQLAIKMVRQALDAFVELDVELARDVCLRDDEVNRQVIDEMYGVMRARSDLVEAAMHFFSASRHVERIADHATNIAEDVIYLVDGEIARHHYTKEEVS